MTILRPQGDAPLPPNLPPEALAMLAQAGHPALQPAAPVHDGMATPAAAPMADDRQQAMDEQRRKQLQGVFGHDFPALLPDATDAAWTRWVERLWGSAEPGIRDRLNEAGRNRLMRAGRQWLSQSARGSYREPLMPKDTVRPVANQIRPALEWQQQVVTEQRPGFRFSPTNTDADRQRRAEAHQLAVEYQFQQQDMDAVTRELVYWAQTDGVSFLCTYWDPERGPWEELDGVHQPLGDVWRKVLRIEQVRVAPNATSTDAPLWWVTCEAMAKSAAIALYGPDVADTTQQDTPSAGGMGVAMMLPGLSMVSPQPLLLDQETVLCFHVFCEPMAALPHGLEVKVVGQKVVIPAQPLTLGRVPVVRFADGSGDPAFFPAPRMNEWIAPQQRINMLLSKWYESIRKNTGGSLVVRDASAVTETLVGGLSIIEVDAAGALDGAIMPLAGFSIGPDVKEALQFETRELENRSGWTDTQRGQFSDSQSGRAILAVREQLERIFAPLVDAICRGMEGWAELQIAWMRHGYQVPRLVGIVGQNRADMARMLSAPDFDGVVDVEIDRETQMPESRAAKLWALQDDFTRGVIDVREYRRRRNYANTDDMSTPDDVQEAKALRVVEALKLGQPPEPIAWQDDEAIHQTVLERHLILAGGIDPQVQAEATARWTALARQAQEKQGVIAPPAAAPAGNHRKEGAPQDPRTQPLASAHPSSAAAPALVQAQQTDPQLAAQRFERSAPQ